MQLKWLLSIAILCLSIWNTALGGTDYLWLCLHTSGETHALEFEASDDCCHVEGSQTLEDCSHCDDVVLEGVDLLALRHNEIPQAKYVALENHCFEQPRVLRHDFEVAGAPSVRAPPHTVNIRRLVTDTIVLRI